MGGGHADLCRGGDAVPCPVQGERAHAPAVCTWLKSMASCGHEWVPGYPDLRAGQTQVAPTDRAVLLSNVVELHSCPSWVRLLRKWLHSRDMYRIHEKAPNI